MAGPVRISIVADGSRARRELEQTASVADRTGSRMGRAFGTAGRVAKVGAVALTGALGGIAASAVKTEADFSQQMNLIGAATGAGGKQLEKLRDLAKEMGAQTAFSANEAAGAMLELSKSGLSPATIRAGALEGTLTLAAAGGTDLATAATVASNALNTFGLEGKNMASVAAALAGGANASSASVESLAFGLSQVGPGAKNAGLNLQETVGVLSAFDAAGIKGSDAGTSLKTMLTRLVPSTDKARDAMRELGLDFTNADGSFQSIEQVAGQLQAKMGDLSAEQRTQALATIFGSDATRAATVLIDEGAKGVRKYVKATKDQGAAQELAEARMAGTTGALERLSGAAETSKLVIGEALAPVVVRIADYLSENMVPATEKAVKWTEDFIGVIQDIRSGDGAGSLGEIGDAVADIDWDKAIDGATAIASSLGEIGSAVGAAGIDVLGSGLKVTGKVLEYAADNSDKLAAAVPFVAAGFLAVKTAQVAANIAMAAAIPIRVAELAATRAQTTAIRAMTIAIQQMTAAQAGSAAGAGRGAWVNGTWYDATRRNTGAANGATTSMTRMARAGQIAGGAAGIGALAFGFSQASQEGITFSSVMSSAAGGAGIGAMFGPIGALVGAGAGAGLGALIGAFGGTKERAKETREELLRAEGFKNAREAADNLRDALAGVITAYGNVSRAAIESSFTGEDGKIAADVARLRELGVSMDTIVSATLGQADAQKIVDRAFGQYARSQEAALPGLKARYDDVRDGMRDVVTATGSLIENGEKINTSTIEEYKKAYEDAQAAVEGTGQLQDNFNQRVGTTGATVRKYRKDVVALAGDLGLTVKQYRQFPKAVRTDFETNGLRQTGDDAVKLIRQYRGLQRFDRIRAVISAPGVAVTRRQIRDLANDYKLTPRQVRTLLKVEGFGDAVKQAGRVRGALKDTEKARPNLTGYNRELKTGVDRGKATAEKGARETSEKLRDGTRRAKADLGPFQTSVRSGTTTATGTAKSGGLQIGVGLGDGVVFGISSRSGAVQGAIVSSVRNAIQAGKNAAKVKSPSRETRYIGDMMGKGLEAGIAGREPAARKKGQDVVRALLAGIVDGSNGVSAAVDKVTRFVEKRIDLKDDKKERAREKAVLKSLKDEFAQLKKNGKAQDRNADALGKARDRYKQLVNEAKQYAATIKDGFVSYGSVVGLGTLGDGPGITSDRITSQLAARLEAAKRFAALIKQLSGSLNATSLQQLIDAGVEGGLATAEALASGGASAITQINQLTSQIAAAGGGLGNAMSDKFKQAGIDAAAGLVLGLEKEQRRLDRAAERIGATIVKAIKKSLGIKSPSKVFRRVGEDSMAGLAIGLDETYARRLGARVGSGVEQGFRRPTLTVTPGSSAAQSAQSSTTVNLNVTVTAGVGASPVAIGRDVVKAVDAYFSAGGKTQVRWSG